MRTLNMASNTTPDVYFFRSKQLDGFQWLVKEEHTFISFIAVVAIRRPNLKADGTYRPTDRRTIGKD